jgi:hypothetical protein
LYDPEVKEWIPQKFLDEVQQSIEATVDYPYTNTQLQQALSNQLTGDEMQQVIDFINQCRTSCRKWQAILKQKRHSKHQYQNGHLA